MRISDWSSDVCSSDLPSARVPLDAARSRRARSSARLCRGNERRYGHVPQSRGAGYGRGDRGGTRTALYRPRRSEEHTSELQSLMRISYAVFCLKTKTKKTHKQHTKTQTPQIRTYT